MNTISEKDFLQYLTYILIDLGYIKKNQTITLSTHLNQDLGLDSLELTEILTLLEDKYNIDLFNVNPGEIHTVKNIFDCINIIKTRHTVIEKTLTQKKPNTK